jgi:hypothetical protein
VQWDHRWVRLMDPSTGELLRESRKQPRGYRSVHPEDTPPKTPPTTVKLLARADRAGKSVGALCRELHRGGREASVRRILGVLSMVKKHGAKAIDDACSVALEVGAPSYRFVRRWIERHPPVPISLRQVDPLIRQLDQYRDLITQRMESDPT